MAEELDYISEYVDLPAVKTQTELLLAQLKRVEDAFNKINSIKVSLDGAVKTKDTVAGIKEAEKASEEFIKTKKRLMDVELAAYRESVRQNNELITTATKLAALDTQKSKAIAIQREELKKASAELRNQAALQGAANNSIDQARARVSLLTKERNGLNLSTKEGTARLKELNAEITKNNTFIKQNVDALAQQKINVGNYPSAVQGAITSLKTLAGAYLGLEGARKVVGFLSDSVDEFNEAEDIVSQLDTVLTNLGRNDALERLQGKAAALMNEFKTIDDEEVIKVFDQLITYGKLTENQIDQLTPVIINFAAKQKISLSDSASVIIKALEGNGKALKEYGINIKDAKGVSEAFGIVMTDLAPKVEGAAKAFGETTRGQIAATKVEIGNLKEEIGEKLQPIIKGFYTFISEAFKGLGIIFTNVTVFARQTYDALAVTFQLAKAVATFDFDEVGRIKESIKLANERKEGIKEMATIQERAQAVATAASKETLAEQEKILRGQEALMNAAAQRNSDLLKSGKAGTDEAKQVAKEYKLAYETVQRLKTVIAQTKDTRVLGAGGDMGNKEKTKAEKQEFYDTELKDEMEHQRKLSEAVELGYAFRTSLRTQAAEIEREIIEGNRNAALANATTEAAQIKINRDYDYQNKKAAEKLAEDLQKIKASSSKYDIDQEKKDRELTLAALREGNDKKIKAIQENEAREIAASVGRKSGRVQEINAEYQKEIEAANGNQEKIIKATEKKNEKLAELEYNHSRFVLELEIQTAKKLIALRESTGVDVTDAKKALAQAEIDLSNLVTDKVLANNQKEIKSSEEKTAKLISDIQKVQQISNEVFGIIGSILDAQIIADKNRLQEQSDNIDKRKEKEIEAANASALTEEEKANKINIINARAQAQKEQIEIRQRQLDEKKARFDKAKNIADIILNTALAVIKALASSGPPANFINAGIVGAIGAAQLAVAIATPIPKYKHGTPKEGHPGGDFIAGDGGKKEFVLMPSGEGFVTKATPTKYTAPKGTHVFPDADEYLRGVFATTHAQIGSAPVEKDNSAQVITDALGKKLDFVARTIANKKETTFFWKNGEQQKIVKQGFQRTEYTNKHVFN